MTPEELAAGWEQTAEWLATRPNGVTWTGDGLDGTVDGIRDSAKALRKHLVPSWAAMIAELATCREHNAGIAVQLDQYRDERDAALSGIEQLAIERDKARDSLDKILHGLSSGEGRPLTDDEVIALCRRGGGG